MDDASAPRPRKAFDLALSALLALGYGAPLILFIGAGVVAAGSAFGGGGAFVALAAVVGTAVAVTALVHRTVVAQGRLNAVRAAEILILVVLPMWGLAYSHALGSPTCTVRSSDFDTAVFRPFAEPAILGLVAFHSVTALAYFVSRKRPRALRPFGEATVHALLGAGIVVHAVVAVHIARWAIVGVVLAPIFLPCLAPLLTVALYVAELRARLRRRGLEAALASPFVKSDSVYRKGPVQEPLPPAPRVHRGMLLRLFATSPVVLGVYAVIHAAWLGHATGALDVVTNTCGHVLSTMPVVMLPENGHYLCTVAAHGHPSLVRPERLGRRGGVVIVVNRQLAIANAFEDLLHERWPLFGRVARRLYDRLALPICRHLKARWLADLTYVVMKPAEWIFALTLLLLDPDDPELRVGRMYRF